MLEKRANKRRPWTTAAAAVAVVLLAAGLFVATRGDSSNGEGGSPTTTDDVHLSFPAPDPADADADEEYLGGDGRVLLVMHERAEAVASAQLTAAGCEQEAAALDVDAPANEVLSLIGGLADPVLRDAFHAERTALGVALTECISGDSADDRAPELSLAVEAVDVRLNELGD